MTGVIITTLTLLLFSCKKSDTAKTPQSVSLRGKYVTGTTAIITPPVMYTFGSIINDAGFIQAFLAKNANTDNFIFNSTAETVQDGLLKLNVISPQNIKTDLTEQYTALTRTFIANIIDSTSTGLILQSINPDTTYYRTQPDKYLFIGKIPPHYIFIDYPAPAGYIGSLRSWQRIPLVIKDDAFYLPVLSYYIKKYLYTGAGKIPNGYNRVRSECNFFDSYRMSIGSSDTLVMQEKFIKLIKQ
jgi:hypothetical protein